MTNVCFVESVFRPICLFQPCYSLIALSHRRNCSLEHIGLLTVTKMHTQIVHTHTNTRTHTNTKAQTNRHKNACTHAHAHTHEHIVNKEVARCFKSVKRASDIRPNFNASDLSLLLHLKAVFVAVYARPDVRIWTDVSLIDVWDPVFFLLDSVQDGHCCFAYVVTEKRVLSFWSGNDFPSLIPPPPSSLSSRMQF